VTRPSRKGTQPGEVPGTSVQMQRLGVVQRGDPRLRRRARPLVLPREAASAKRLVAELLAAMDGIAEVHVFGKGMGLAAPQLGIGRAAAVVRPHESPDAPIVLLNPTIAGRAEESDEQYEGCLSFFEVRGLVPRPLWIDVATDTFLGKRTVHRYERGLARLVSHEIDHLDGILYVDRMRAGVATIPLDDYRGTGSAWSY
jgi:peptide deformylase